MNNAIQQAALEYASKGWRVVPIMPGGKRPLIQAWQREASADEERVAEWWSRWPDANVGVRFGRDSDLIDIECDDDTQEQALLALFGGEFPITPTFRSSRGKHRLFRWASELPYSDSKGIVYVGGVGFRTGGGANGAQSVFPPSVHQSGAVYQWLIPPDEADVATIPAEVLLRIANHDGGLFGGATNGNGKSPEHWIGILGGVDGGHRNQSAAELIGRTLADLADPFDEAVIARTWEYVQIWNRQNRPPIDSAELETTWRSILRRHRESRAAEEFGAALNRYVEPARPTEAGEMPPGWRLVRVEANPVQWRLYSPLWSDKGDGFITVSSAAILSDRAIAEAALEQVAVWLGADFRMIWRGTKKQEGLGSRLTRTAETEEAEPEDRRDAMVADLALYQLWKASRAEAPATDGSPTMLPDGRILLKARSLTAKMQMTDRDIQFSDVTEILRTSGAGSTVQRVNGTVHRFRVVTRENIEEMRKIARIGAVDE